MIHNNEEALHKPTDLHTLYRTWGDQSSPSPSGGGVGGGAGAVGVQAICSVMRPDDKIKRKIMKQNIIHIFFSKEIITVTKLFHHPIFNTLKQNKNFQMNSFFLYTKKKISAITVII